MVARIIEVTRRGRKGEQGNPGPDNLAALTTGGSSTVYTITNASPVLSYEDGYGVTVKAHVTSGVTPTANVDALGAKSIKKLSGGSVVAIATGDMVINQFYVLHYSSDADALLLFGADLPVNIVLDITPQLGGFLDTNSFQVRWSKGADVASASALPLGTDGNLFDITGTTPITSIGTLGVGTTVMLRATAALPLTHHATDLILLGGVSVTLAAGDWVIFTENAVGKWTMVSVSFPIATFTDATTGTQNTKYMTALRTKQAIAEFSAPVQIITSVDGAVATGTTLIPGNDTIPQNTEGDEYLSVTITPKSATNLLVVSLETAFGHAVLGTISVALFKNSDADALAVFGVTGEATDRRSLITLTHALVAGGTSAITFKVRAGGSNAGTITLNGTSSARKYGGKSASHITVTEYFAS